MGKCYPKLQISGCLENGPLSAMTAFSAYNMSLPLTNTQRSTAVEKTNLPKPRGGSPYICQEDSDSDSDMKPGSAMSNSGHRSHACSWADCGKRFDRRADLKRHERVHRNERPFSCSICLKTFRQKGGLINHRYSHTGERPFKCELESCDMCFTDPSTLSRHRRAKHKIMNKPKNKKGRNVYTISPNRRHRRIIKRERVDDEAFHDAQAAHYPLPLKVESHLPIRKLGPLPPPLQPNLILSPNDQGISKDYCGHPNHSQPSSANAPSAAGSMAVASQANAWLALPMASELSAQAAHHAKFNSPVINAVATGMLPHSFQGRGCQPERCFVNELYATADVPTPSNASRSMSVCSDTFVFDGSFAESWTDEAFCSSHSQSSVHLTYSPVDEHNYLDHSQTIHSVCNGNSPALTELINVDPFSEQNMTGSGQDVSSPSPTTHLNARSGVKIMPSSCDTNARKVECKL